MYQAGFSKVFVIDDFVLNAICLLKLLLPSISRLQKKPSIFITTLKRILDKGVMLGHQDDLAYGFGWKYEAGRSDVKDVTGDLSCNNGF
jgi:hypothetical protein